jgi:hypothetical protein
VLRERFISLSAYIINTEKSQINDLMMHLKLIEKQDKAKLKTSRRMKIRDEVTPKKNHTKNNGPKSLLYENINKIDKPLANPTK